MDGVERRFVSDTYQSLAVNVCEDVPYDSVLIYTDSGRPLVTLKKIGNGTLCFVNAKEYAGSPAVELAFREVIAHLAADCVAKETVYARGDRNVQFAVYDTEDGGRDIYFIATDWHKSVPDGEGTLILDSHEYIVPVPWGQLVKVSAWGDGAIYPERDENEVISFDGKIARLQGVGLATFVLCRNGVSKKFTVDFSVGSVKNVCIEKLDTVDM
jgi:hypothetical protein